MVYQLLELPPEILAQILSLLPVRTLLKFSEISQHARSLANSNLHTLNLGIRPIRARKGPKNTDNDFWVRIPGARSFAYPTRLKFHNALFQSILARHADTLYIVNLSLWTLTRPIAEGLSKLYALQRLSISIEDDLYTRAVPRSRMAAERLEQAKAWDLLGQAAVWTQRLRSLSIDHADLTTAQLAMLLRRSRRCGSLRFSGCRFIGQEMWQFLARDWDGRAGLQSLHVAESGGCLNDKALGAIAGLSGLQVCLCR